MQLPATVLAMHGVQFVPGEPAVRAFIMNPAGPEDRLHEPDGFADSAVRPDGAFWLADLGEFALPYEAVRGSNDPDAALTEFLQSTYAAAADMAGWDRARLERPAGYTPTN